MIEKTYSFEIVNGVMYLLSKVDNFMFFLEALLFDYITHSIDSFQHVVFSWQNSLYPLLRNNLKLRDPYNIWKLLLQFRSHK